MKNDPDYPPNAIDMMERRLIREIELADDPFNRHLAVVLLEYYYSGEYEFWMKEGEIMFRSIELDDDMNNPQDTEYDDE